MIAFFLFGVIFFQAALLKHTQGRCGPVAALTFLLAGPVLWVLIIAAILVAAGIDPDRAELLQARMQGPGYEGFWMVLLLATIVAPVIASGIYAVAKREEFGYVRDENDDAPRPVRSVAMRALGLNASATLDDVETAYRERAAQLSHDGADPAAFDRLDAYYERARKLVALRTPPRQGQAL